MKRPSSFLIPILAFLILAVSPADILAQYFGRNKVQYDEFRFRVLETEHFDIFYYPQKEEAIHDIARMAERWHERLSAIFNHEFAERKPIVFYADDADFQQTNVIQGFIQQGTGGVTEGLKNRIVMPMTGIHSETDHVLGHELVHVFQFDIAQRDTAIFRMGQMPLWFIEGKAEYLTLGREDTHTAMWMRDAVLRDDLPTIQQLTRDRRYFPYRFGQAFWAFVGGTYGDEVVHQLYRLGGRIGLDSAFVRVLGVNSDSLSALWHAATRQAFEPLMEGRQAPADIGRLVLAREIDAGRMNLGPSLSPDGRNVAFLSERDLFGIDLFLADAETGSVTRRLVSAETDPHFDALRFINSAGGWSPDGRLFAFVVFAEGENRIAILDMERRRVRTRIRVPNVGTITNPTWSPDGEWLAFSGMRGGFSNLYMVNVGTREVRQLTNDRHSVLHPAFSRDGRRIAFATDRGPGTDFDLLTYGPQQIAMYNLETGEIEALPLFQDATHTNPQFSPDGNELYFVADPDGFTNIYRVDLGAGTISRITNLATGISGLTQLSPALTIAQQTGRLMYSVMQEGRHNVHALEVEEIEAMAQVVDAAAPPPEFVARGNVLPPLPVQETPVATYLADARTGLVPPETDFELARYRPRLVLDYIGSPGIGVATTSFGTGLVGGVMFFFSDMLGNHNLGAAVQAQGTVKDIGGQVGYWNLENRLNWGASVSRIPVLSGFAQLSQENIQIGDRVVTALVLNRILQRQFFNEIAAHAAYPFSMTRRVEVQGGYTRVGFDFEVDRLFYVGNQLVARERESLDAPPGLNLFELLGAYVGDTSFFGLTSPVRGQRYRFQMGGTLGTLSFATLLADYRRYILMRPVTLAFRGLHFGRYGPDAEGRALQPLFLGNEQFIRGYSIFSLTAPEFGEIQHLLVGSRIGVMNAEVRVPVLGVEGFGLVNFPYLPTELGLFADAGLAWDSDRTPEFRFDRRPGPNDQVPVMSAGASARVNLLGALILEFYYAYPFQRPETGWHFGFQIMPGW